ncbi:GatB/YqeY domain-containing protein [Priestia aryabhattai]|uniref:GatB/YqeY domain-containing protein n=1 Tax=Priestia aryabhattai TaxID=412384 RepID=UPI00399F0275
MNTKISQIKTDNLQALKDRDSNKKSILQILLTTFDNERVKLGYKTTSELSNDEVLTCINRVLKQLQQELSFIEEAGRNTELVDKQIEIITAYLPKQLTYEELFDEIAKIVRATKKAEGNMGVAMKEVSAKLKGQCDMGKASRIVKELFTNGGNK